MSIGWTEVAAVGAPLLVTLLCSGILVRWAVGSETQEGRGRDTGMIIGKCENILTFVFILLGAPTALAILFTAKSIVRREDISKNPLYFLGGTLVNFTFSVLLAGLALVALKFLGGDWRWG